MTRPRPTISVLLPVLNEAAAIGRTLEALRKQTLPADRYEVLLCDGGSTDGTRRIARKARRSFPQLRTFHNPRHFSSAGRNIGLRRARGRSIVIIDGHCEVPADYLEKVLFAFEESGAYALGRPQPLECENPSPFQQAVKFARTSWLGHNPDSAIFSNEPGPMRAENVAVAYRREVFEWIGGFDESFDACEDVDFNRRFDRAGLRCHFAPEIGLAYRPRGSSGAVFHQMFRYGVGRARLAKKDPASLTPEALGPSLLVLGLCALPFIGWSVRLVAAAYPLIVAVESLRRGRRNLRVLLRLPAVYSAIHFGFGMGFLVECLRFSVPRNVWRRMALGSRSITVPVVHPAGD